MSNVTESLAQYLSEHISKGGLYGPNLSIGEARVKVEAGYLEEDDTYVALLQDRDNQIEVYSLGESARDVLDYGSDLLYEGRVPTVLLHFANGEWDTVDVEYRMTVA